MAREKELCDAGYTVVTVWEHEVDEQIERDETMKEFFDKCRVVGPLRPRDGFSGKRS